MIIKMLTIALLTFNLLSQQPEQTNVQIYDVKQEKVIKEQPLTSHLQESIITLLDSSPTIYSGFTMDPKDGFILHIQFNKPIQLTSDLYPDFVKETYIFLEQGVPPKALIFFHTLKKNMLIVLDESSDQFMIRHQLIREQ